MLEQAGDIWTTDADARCVTTNGILRRDGALIMGKGIALEAAKRFPGIDRILGEKVRTQGNVPYYVPEHQVFSFPTKQHWRDKSSLPLISRAHHLVELVNLLCMNKVILPRPGCGSGGLQWEEVKPAIEKYSMTDLPSSTPSEEKPSTS